MTDNSILKESMESEKHGELFTDDIKHDLLMAEDEEKDDDNSERNKFINAWVAKLVGKDKGKLVNFLPKNRILHTLTIHLIPFFVLLTQDKK